jgi:hypothetical protein
VTTALGTAAAGINAASPNFAAIQTALTSICTVPTNLVMPSGATTLPFIQTWCTNLTS